MPDDRKMCAMHVERQDWQEAIEVMATKFAVRRTGIPTLACARAPGCGVVEPPRALGLVEGNRNDTSIAAAIMVAKYAYRLLVYHQPDSFASYGWTPAGSTVLSVLKSAAHRAAPPRGAADGPGHRSG